MKRQVVLDAEATSLELLDFLDRAELVIHNAPFDIKFLN